MVTIKATRIAAIKAHQISGLPILRIASEQEEAVHPFDPIFGDS